MPRFQSSQSCCSILILVHPDVTSALMSSFVISGYLITRLILKDLSAGTDCRFLGTAFSPDHAGLSVMIGAVLLAGYCLLLPNQLAELARSSVATPLPANFYFWRDTGYFAACRSQAPVAHGQPSQSKSNSTSFFLCLVIW